MVTVRIPATSANLGSGFDTLGIAVSLYNEIEFKESDLVEIISTDGTDIPLDETNLIYKSAKMLYEHVGKDLKGLCIKQTNNIPLARGLGSSSACIVGGIVGANKLLGSPLTTKELLVIATKIEGHPDNVAPALLGGLITAVLEGDHVYYVKDNLADDLSFVVVIPDMEMETEAARAALPKKVSHSDACFNVARSALMAKSLSSGRYENLRVAAGDKLHQSYRFMQIPNGPEIVDYAYDIGAYAAMISGAGPTMMAIVDKGNSRFTDKMADYIQYLGHTGWKVASYSADNQGAICL